MVFGILGIILFSIVFIIGGVAIFSHLILTLVKGHSQGSAKVDKSSILSSTINEKKIKAEEIDLRNQIQEINYNVLGILTWWEVIALIIYLSPEKCLRNREIISSRILKRFSSTKLNDSLDRTVSSILTIHSEPGSSNCKSRHHPIIFRKDRISSYWHLNDFGEITAAKALDRVAIKSNLKNELEAKQNTEMVCKTEVSLILSTETINAKVNFDKELNYENMVERKQVSEAPNPKYKTHQKNYKKRERNTRLVRFWSGWPVDWEDEREVADSLGHSYEPKSKKYYNDNEQPLFGKVNPKDGFIIDEVDEDILE